MFLKFLAFLEFGVPEVGVSPNPRNCRNFRNPRNLD